MNYLIDTNVISEVLKSDRDANVAKWFNATSEDQMWLSVMTIAEIRFGIEIMADGRRRSSLGAWLETELPERFEGRIITIGTLVADSYGRVMARARKLGRRLEVVDGLLAATAQVHQMTFVTRNTKDFEALDIPLINPWVGSG